MTPEEMAKFVQNHIEKQKEADARHASELKSTRQLIERECEKLLETLLAKNADYGDSAFESPVLCPGVEAGMAIRIRMSDKIKRIVQLESHPAKVQSEPLEDAYRDLAGYCILRLIEMKKQEFPE